MLGENLGKLEGLQGKGFVVKNWQIPNTNSNKVSRIPKTVLVNRTSLVWKTIVKKSLKEYEEKRQLGLLDKFKTFKYIVLFRGKEK